MSDTEFDEFAVALRGNRLGMVLAISNAFILDPMVLPQDLEAEKKTVLDWWLAVKQRHRFPLLPMMAIDIYSVPAMSLGA